MRGDPAASSEAEVRAVHSGYVLRRVTPLDRVAIPLGCGGGRNRVRVWRAGALRPRRKRAYDFASACVLRVRLGARRGPSCV